MLDPTMFRARVERRMRGKEAARRVLALLVGTWPGEPTLLGGLSVPSLSLLVRVAGQHFPPSDSPGGWVGRQETDAAMGDVIRTILERLGRNPTREVSRELALLRDNPTLSAWRELAAHHLATQVRNRRDAEFRYPTVQAVVEALRGGDPANIKDLRALIVAHLRETGEDLRHGSTDGYKALWTVDSYERPLRPQPEGYCRDRILERLRSHLRPLNVIAEPEGHFADDKRADIKVLAGPLTLPVEIKRHYNPELWTAPRDQLQKRYARDPGSHGHGIYLVLWFGLAQRSIPAPPNNLRHPTSPRELESALTETLSVEDEAMTTVVVFDVSPTS